MAPLSQIVPIQRTNTSSSTSNKTDIWFNAFDFTSGQDEHIRWLSRPNQQLVQQKYSHDTEKFRITFDVENFQADQIKICIQYRKLTISGVYEERSEGHFMQKQFERTLDIPANADVDSMASFITPAHMLVVEIPLHSSTQIDNFNINENYSNQRRLSFSLNKFNTSDNQGLLSTSNDLSNSSTLGQQVQRTSMSKTTTTSTTSGSSTLPSEAVELLKSADTSTGNSSETYSTHTTDRHSSNTGNQILNSAPNTSCTTKSSTYSTNQTGSVPINRSNDTESLSSTNTSTTHSTNQTGCVPINRSNDTQSSLSSTNTNNRSSNTSSNTLNQQQLNTSERRDLKTISSNNQSQMYTLEEFLQNKTWNPSIVDGSDGKKILHMRLQMKPGTKSDQMKILLNGHDLRVEADNKVTTECGRQMSGFSYHQVSLFTMCEVDQLKTEFKDDGYLHIQAPINL